MLKDNIYSNITYKYKIITHTAVIYSPYNERLERVQTIRDLGVISSPNFTFNAHHIYAIYVKAY